MSKKSNFIFKVLIASLFSLTVDNSTMASNSDPWSHDTIVSGMSQLQAIQTKMDDNAAPYNTGSGSVIKAKQVIASVSQKIAELKTVSDHQQLVADMLVVGKDLVKIKDGFDANLNKRIQHPDLIAIQKEVDYVLSFLLDGFQSVQ